MKAIFKGIWILSVFTEYYVWILDAQNCEWQKKSLKIDLFKIYPVSVKTYVASLLHSEYYLQLLQTVWCGINSNVLMGENPCFNKESHMLFVINLLRDFLNTRSRAVLKSDVRIRDVQRSKPKSVTWNVTFMTWKRRNKNTCSEHAFFAEILSRNTRIFQYIFFKLSSFLVSQNVLMQ